MIIISISVCKNLGSIIIQVKSMKARCRQHNYITKGERPKITVGMGTLLTHKEDYMAKNSMNAALIFQGSPGQPSWSVNLVSACF